MKIALNLTSVMAADLNKSGSVDWYDLAQLAEFWLLNTNQ
jgi:hypothetical protein